MQEIKDYLLGTLELDRRTRLEERILCDPEAYEELLFVEEELIDQYVAGALSKLEQHQFETHFLITAERQKNLRFGRLLKKYLNSGQNFQLAVGDAGQTATTKRSLPFYLGPFGPKPALAFSAVAVALIGIIFLCWLVIRKPGETTSQQTVQRVMVITLTPGSTRSGGTTPRVTIPPKGVDVKLELELTNTSFQYYKSQLFRETQPLQTRNELKMETKGAQHIIPLTIAGAILSPGDYQVRLSGVLDSGEEEFIDNYSFRVTE